MTTLQHGPGGAVEPAPRPSVVERVTLIFDAFVLGPERLLLEDVVALTGLPRSTAFRILTQLCERLWVEHDNRGYRLGTRAYGMASRRHRENDDLRAATSSTLNELHAATGAVAHLGVLEGGRVHYLDKIGGVVVGSVPSRVGSRLPADRTACGKALLACLTPGQVDTLVATVPRRHAPDLSALHRQLNLVRRQRGVAVDSADGCPMGITAIAAPIVGPAGAAGAISLATKEPLSLDRFAPLVLQAARRSALLLHPEWSPRERTDLHAGRRVAG